MEKRRPKTRKTISIVRAVMMAKDEGTAEKWLIEQRWPDGPQCPSCGTDNPSLRRRSGSPLQWFVCRNRKTKSKPGCGKMFSVKTDTVMHDSKLPLSKWYLAFFLFSTSKKGVSSHKLANDLDITQKSAWHLGHRIRLALKTMDADAKLDGPVEVDETFIGGRERNKHANKKLRAGRGTVGKSAVVGMRDRGSNQIVAQFVESTTGDALKGFVTENTWDDAKVFTDEARAYIGLQRERETVNHSSGEYVKGMAHTNGIESFWSVLKRGYVGVFHHFSAKHLQRYVDEFTGRHNIRPMDTLDQMRAIARGTEHRRLRYATLIGAKETRRPSLIRDWGVDEASR